MPPSTPKSPRCSALSDTALAIQWKQNPERDIRGYRIAYSGIVSGNEDVDGNKTTYYELKELRQTRSPASECAPLTIPAMKAHRRVKLNVRRGLRLRWLSRP
ncbi:MAG: fibronectin type III domain-containing protein [Caldilineaceae bacterium]